MTPNCEEISSRRFLESAQGWSKHMVLCHCFPLQSLISDHCPLCLVCQLVSSSACSTSFILCFPEWKFENLSITCSAKLTPPRCLASCLESRARRSAVPGHSFIRANIPCCDVEITLESQSSLYLGLIKGLIG
jgi:hypothetical protein